MNFGNAIEWTGQGSFGNRGPCVRVTTYYRLLALLSVVAMLASSCSLGQNSVKQIPRTAGETTISKWKGGKKAVYLISFDDNLPSQLENVIPELNKRQIVGTFFVVTGSPLWVDNEQQWAEAAQSPFVTLANHTFTHQGVDNADELDRELEESNAVLYRVYANRSEPFLLGFARPGGVSWNVSEREQASALKAHNLVDRPQFRGSPVNNTTLQELVASVDDAIARGEMGHNDMHGVGGDYLTTPLEWFTALLDKLEAERAQVWVPDLVSYAKYLAERQGAEVKVVQADSTKITVALTSAVDPTLYDYPLTLKTEVPADWSGALVTQGIRSTKVAVQDGVVMYEALPGAEVVHIARR